jgi:hypothetical protein
MTELRFHRELYAAAAVDTAAEALARHATIERAEEPPYQVVRVHCDDTTRERAIAGTLANLALARTVEAGGPRR